MTLLVNLDCREGMAMFLGDSSVDSIVTDPPYGLSFMGNAWDHGVPGVEYWTEALRVLKPGGHILAFGGSRTYHRMACAIEDAGFEIRDQIMWIYGSGFPKASNLKPAHEPICLARKPFKGSAEKNMQQWGTGELNVGTCRVGDEVRHEAFNKLTHGNKLGAAGTHAARHGTTGEKQEYVGRWPANLIHDGSDEVLAAFPDAPGQMADVKLDGTKSKNVYGAMQRSGEASQNSENTGAVGFKMKPGARRMDAGSAARFFYCAKASKSDRGEGNTHPTVKPTELMRYLCRLVTPPGGLVVDPFMGSGSTGRAARLEGFEFMGFETDKSYFQIAQQRVV